MVSVAYPLPFVGLFASMEQCTLYLIYLFNKIASLKNWNFLDLVRITYGILLINKSHIIVEYYFNEFIEK